MSKTLLVTGSSGLIGSEVCVYFARELGYTVHGVDNNQRAVFFGPSGDTRWNQNRLAADLPGFVHHELDIRDRAGVLALVKPVRPSVIVHTAAQPSHDRAAAIPFDDFDTNAVGTLNFLEAARQAAPESPFVHMSTNKVYGDAPNRIALTELATRWDYADPAYEHGIAETFTIDQSKHSLFGASKVAADVMVQEYGRYFGLPTCALMAAFVAAPRAGEVYNLGGGKANSTSILEAFKIAEKFTGQAQVHTYVNENRAGDHICYYSDLRKMRAHYPAWDITQSLEETIRQIVVSWKKRNSS